MMTAAKPLHVTDIALMEYVLKLEAEPAHREQTRAHLADCEHCRSRSERIRLDLSAVPVRPTPQDGRLARRTPKVESPPVASTPNDLRVLMIVGTMAGIAMAAVGIWLGAV